MFLKNTSPGFRYPSPGLFPVDLEITRFAGDKTDWKVWDRIMVLIVLLQSLSSVNVTGLLVYPFFLLIHRLNYFL